MPQEWAGWHLCSGISLVEGSPQCSGDVLGPLSPASLIRNDVQEPPDGNLGGQGVPWVVTAAPSGTAGCFHGNHSKVPVSVSESLKPGRGGQDKVSAAETTETSVRGALRNQTAVFPQNSFYGTLNNLQKATKVVFTRMHVVNRGIISHQCVYGWSQWPLFSLCPQCHLYTHQYTHTRALSTDMLASGHVLTA